MAEAVTFWLDNKVSSGVKVAEIGGQTLVSYRDKFYVVEGGAAMMRGSRPLHYSKSSLPAAWKRAMRGMTPRLDAVSTPEDDTLPRMTITGKERTKMEKSSPAAANDRAETEQTQDQLPQTMPAHSVSAKAEKRPAKSLKKVENQAGAQAAVVAACPYCGHRHDLPPEKGKNGKPFFVACARCNRDFAVRFVPVTVYQAQVAAFK